jgi:hypothetical protein
MTKGYKKRPVLNAQGAFWGLFSSKQTFGPKTPLPVFWGAKMSYLSDLNVTITDVCFSVVQENEVVATLEIYTTRCDKNKRSHY